MRRERQAAWVGVVVVALAMQAGCRCGSEPRRSSAPPAPKPSGPVAPAPALAPASPAPLPAAATATRAPAATPSLTLPLGLADAPPWFAAARRDLRTRLAPSVAPGNVSWRRTRGLALRDDDLRFGDRSVAIVLADLDVVIERDATGCTVRSDAAPATRAGCEPDAAAGVDVLAALSALVRDDLAPAWTLEAVHTDDAGAVRMRASLRPWRLRVVLDLDPQGQVRAWSTAAVQARLQQGAAELAIDVLVGTTLAWTWRPLPGQVTQAVAPAARPSHLQFVAQPGEGLGSLIERVEGAIRTADVTPVGLPLLSAKVAAGALVWTDARLAALRSSDLRQEPQGATWQPPAPLGPVVQVLEGGPDSWPRRLGGLAPGCYHVQPLGRARSPSAEESLVALVRSCP